MSDYSVSNPANPASAANNTNTSAPLVAIYWLIVLVPLGWGVYQTVQKSVPLFHVAGTTPARADAAATPTTAASPAAAPAATPSDSATPFTVPTGTPL